MKKKEEKTIKTVLDIHTVLLKTQGTKKNKINSIVELLVLLSINRLKIANPKRINTDTNKTISETKIGDICSYLLSSGYIKRANNPSRKHPMYCITDDGQRIVKNLAYSL